MNFCDLPSTEYIPIGLRDETIKLPMSYFLINPLLEIDVLNYQASLFTFFFDESQSGTKEVILDSNKLKNAPNVFRIKHEYFYIVISQVVVDELKKHNISNLEIKKIPQLPKENTIDDEQYKLNTALFSASEHNEFELAISMVKRGANINYTSPKGTSTLQILQEKGQTQIIDLFNKLKP
ncbi:hypothetical protein HHX25_04340 [Flavivirga sp. Y03]|uniref:Ankyrin repeat domain-containing protein n=2 Tax=Flavivirga algicola TaxID=2729136 RepID=A0ABX1RU72_9FLAO|nr:hypothetical protein [Flavivirga algicola]NMH86721.1 hypothetical protein [Flavivirga algicola]